MDGPVLLARADRQGARVRAGREGPGASTTPRPRSRRRATAIIPLKTSSSNGLHRRRQRGPLRGDAARPARSPCSRPRCARGTSSRRSATPSPSRFFDVGICESHAVAFAAGMAKAGARPVVDIYSTFLQRSYRPDLPGSRAAEPAGRLHARPRRAWSGPTVRRTTAPTTWPTCGSSPTWS